MSILDVAKVAGVSHTTVSRVINGHPSVSVNSALRVKQAMEQLNYTPPIKRRGPVRKKNVQTKTGNIGVLFCGLRASFDDESLVNQMIHAIDRALIQAGYNMLFAHVQGSDRLPPMVASGDIDGLLLHGFVPSELVTCKLQCHPTVWLLSPRDRYGYWGDRVSPDNIAISQLAVDYLHHKGHQHIAYMGACMVHQGYKDREEIFVIRANDLEIKASLLFESLEQMKPYEAEDYDQRMSVGIDQILAQFLELPTRPTGVFISSSGMLPMFYRKFLEKGIELGRDIEVITCDKHRFINSLLPTPAVIDIQPEIIGFQAVKQLLWRIENPDEQAAMQIVVPAKLIPPFA